MTQLYQYLPQLPSFFVRSPREKNCTHLRFLLVGSGFLHVLVIFRTTPDDVGSGHRTNSVVTPSGSICFSYGVPEYVQGNIPPYWRVRIIPFALSNNKKQILPRSSGYLNFSPFLCLEHLPSKTSSSMLYASFDMLKTSIRPIRHRLSILSSISTFLLLSPSSEGPS
jgi:hypothetical protein